MQLLDSGAVCGNVREKGLSEIIRENGTFKALRSREKLTGKCGRCHYRESCGGCRALAYYHNGDILAEDPSCFFEPANAQTRCDLEGMQTAKLGEFLEYLKFNKPWNSLF